MSIYNYQAEKIIALVDVGNTALKIRVVRDGKQANSRISYNPGWLDKANRILSKVPQQNIVYCSSYPKAQKLLTGMGLLSSMSMKASTLVNADNLKSKAENGQLLLDYEHIKGIGTDRILSLFGALSHFCQQEIHPQHVAVVSYGTATTVTIGEKVEQFYKCIGGSIQPGMRAQRATIKRILPNCEFISPEDTTDAIADTNFFLANDNSKNRNPFGESTETAVCYGLVKATLHGLISDLEAISDDYKIVITGGDAKQAVDYLQSIQKPFVHLPELVIETMEELAKSDLEERCTHQYEFADSF